MHLRFYPLRFEFRAEESLFFPPGKAANILRGALGTVFRKIACAPQCESARTCALRESCPYARVFEPTATGAGPSGLADWPRPFVFRARHLDGRTVRPGESFSFDLHVFSLDQEVLAGFVRAFARLASEGLGPGRGKAELQAGPVIEPVSLDLTPSPVSVRRIRVHFLTPTELKHEDGIAERPEFPILFGRIRDRIATLSRLYGDGALDIDFQGSNARAAVVQMTACRLQRREGERRSSKTGQVHSIGGFVGEAEYEGDLGEFLPFLDAARWTGVGRQSVWGKGEINTIWFPTRSGTCGRAPDCPSPGG